jgi:hypothetical protein
MYKGHVVQLRVNRGLVFSTNLSKTGVGSVARSTVKVNRLFESLVRQSALAEYTARNLLIQTLDLRYGRLRLFKRELELCIWPKPDAKHFSLTRE